MMVHGIVSTTVQLPENFHAVLTGRVGQDYTIGTESDRRCGTGTERLLNICIYLILSFAIWTSSDSEEIAEGHAAYRDSETTLQNRA